jgi:hypothetical protein
MTYDHPGTKISLHRKLVWRLEDWMTVENGYEVTQDALEYGTLLGMWPVAG